MVREQNALGRCQYFLGSGQGTWSRPGLRLRRGRSCLAQRQSSMPGHRDGRGSGSCLGGSSAAAARVPPRPGSLCQSGHGTAPPRRNQCPLRSQAHPRQPPLAASSRSEAAGTPPAFRFRCAPRHSATGPGRPPRCHNPPAAQASRAAWRSCRASAAGSSGATNSPVVPSMTASRFPPTADTITGVPQAMACRAASPLGS